MAYTSIFTDKVEVKPTGYKSIFSTPPPPFTSADPSIKILRGGGAFNVGATPEELIKTGHTTYGGLPTKRGFERADIVPVSLGGSNQSIENILYEPYSTVEKIKDKLYEMVGKGYIPKTATDKYLLEEILPKYKSGKMSLAEARLKTMSFLKIKMSGVKQGTLANLPEALNEAIPSVVGGFLKGFVSPFVSAGISAFNLARNIASVSEATMLGKKEAVDYGKTSYNIPIYGEAEPLLTGQEEPVELLKKVAGTSLEVSAYFVGVGEVKGLLKTIDTIGAKSISKITAQEATQFAKAYATKVAISALKLGTMFGLGGTIKEGELTPGKEVEHTAQAAKNVATAIGMIALLEVVLSPLISYGLKNIKGLTAKKSVDKVLEDHKVEIEKKVKEIETQAVEQPVKKGYQSIFPLKEKPNKGFEPVVKPKPIPKPPEVKPSGVAKQIEASAIEAKLTKGYKDVAEFDSRTFKEEARKTSDLINSGIDKARAVVRGEVPTDIRAGAVIAGMETYAKAHPKEAASIIQELVNSPLATTISEGASETSLARLRKDSVSAQLSDVKKTREGKVKDLPKKKTKSKKELKAEKEKFNLTKEERSFNNFLDKITC